MNALTPSTAPNATLLESLPARMGYTQAQDGTSLYYRAIGSGLPLLACNGFAVTNTFWKTVEKFFAPRLHFLNWDYKGHGLSNQPNDWRTVTIEHFADDAVRILDHLRIEQAVLMGHSMGVQVIFELYHRYPDRVLALIPVCGSFGRPFDTFLHTSFMRYFFTLPYFATFLFPASMKKFLSLATLEPIAGAIAETIGVNKHLMDLDAMTEYYVHLGQIDPKLFFTLARNMQQHSAESYLKEIAVPTLIIAGAKDHFTPIWINLKMHEQICNSELLVIPEGQHVAQMEMPKLTHCRIDAFLRKQFPSRYSPSPSTCQEPSA